MDSSEEVFLFIVMQPNKKFTDQLALELKNAIRNGLSSKHVPRLIIGVDEIPITVNGKKIEGLVKQIVSTGKLPTTISSTVANPQCLDRFKKYYDFETSKERRGKL